MLAKKYTAGRLYYVTGTGTVHIMYNTSTVRYGIVLVETFTKGLTGAGTVVRIVFLL